MDDGERGTDGLDVPSELIKHLGDTLLDVGAEDEHMDLSSAYITAARRSDFGGDCAYLLSVPAVVTRRPPSSTVSRAHLTPSFIWSIEREDEAQYLRALGIKMSFNSPPSTFQSRYSSSLGSFATPRESNMGSGRWRMSRRRGDSSTWTCFFATTDRGSKSSSRGTGRKSMADGFSSPHWRWLMVVVSG